MGGLTISALTKRYKDETVLDGIDLDVPAGGTLALFGPSGAGKTTVLGAVAGLYRPDEAQWDFGRAKEAPGRWVETSRGRGTSSTPKAPGCCSTAV